jgi:hypothetical protein
VVASLLQAPEGSVDEQVLVQHVDAVQACAGVRGPAVDVQAEGQRSGAGSDQRRAGRLADDRQVAGVTALQGREGPQAAVLLADHALQQHPAAQAHAGSAQRPDRHELAGQAAFMSQAPRPKILPSRT